MDVPKRASYIVVGAGIHGLSTAYHLAKELVARGLGSGDDVLVLDKSRPGAGASGIACGVVRNNYFQPAMSELMQACVEVWESDPGGVRIQPRRLHRARRGSTGVGSHGDLRAPGTDRLPLRAHPRRGGGRRAHEGSLPRLAREGRHRVPPRAPGRVRLQHGLRRRAPRQVPRGGRLRSDRRRGHRLRGRRRRFDHDGGDLRGAGRGR